MRASCAISLIIVMQPRHAEVHAPLAEREDFRILERVRLAVLDLRRAALLRLGGHRRNLAVRRIDDERGPPIVPVALDHPELVVIAGAGGIVRGRLRDVIQHGEDQAVAELRVAVVLGDLRRELLEFGDLCFGRCSGVTVLFAQTP
jgi:hypothetical protein